MVPGGVIPGPHIIEVPQKTSWSSRHHLTRVEPVSFNNWKNHPVYFLNWCWCFWCVHTLFMLFAINLLSSHPSWASNKFCRNDLRWETLPNRVAWSLLRGLKVASAEGNFQLKTVLFLAILAFHSSCFRLMDVRKTGKERQFFLSQRLVYGSCCTFGAWTWVSGGSQSIDIKPWCFQGEGGVLAKGYISGYIIWRRTTSWKHE